MTRKIVLDTETTGLDPKQGHRLVEIGCVELINYVPTGEVFHVYINPERDVPKEAFNVHGLSYDFLKDHPLFKEVGESFLDFIQDSPLVIHNARFDMKFLNAELKTHNWKELCFSRTIDTLTMARQKFPGSPASLDALCKRFGVDNKARDKHGALLDSELLAQVYLELIGGKQPNLSFNPQSTPAQENEEKSEKKELRPARPHEATEEEKALHQNLVDQLNEPLWGKG